MDNPKVESFIDNMITADNVKARHDFNDMMSTITGDKIEAKKAEMAAEIVAPAVEAPVEELSAAENVETSTTEAE
jgi:hypothetical protein